MRLARTPVRPTSLAPCAASTPWLAELPTTHIRDAALLARRSVGATPERMLRELTDALEALSEA